MESKTRRQSFVVAPRNIITTKLATSLANVNVFTNKYLTETLSESINQLSTVSTSPEDDADLAALQDAFQEIYYLVDAQREAEGKKKRTIGPKATFLLLTDTDPQMPPISISQLRHILAKIKDLKVSDGRVKELNLYAAIAETLNNFISIYLLLVVYTHAANVLIELTILSNEQLLYWDSVATSTFLKYLYLVQVAPQRIVDMSRNIASDFKERILSVHDDKYSLATKQQQHDVLANTSLDWPSNTEEDNPLYHFVDHSYRVLNVLSISVTKTISKFLDSISLPSYLFFQMNSHLNRGGNSFKTSTRDISSKQLFHKAVKNLGVYLRIILGAPTRAINSEIGQKRATINDDIESAAYSLGILIEKLPTKEFDESEELSTFIRQGEHYGVSDILGKLEQIFKVERVNASGAKNINARLYDITTSIDNFQISNPKTQVPSYLNRNWPWLLLLLGFGPRAWIRAYLNRMEILDWCRVNMYETVVGFFKNWVIKPMSDMLSVIRHDDSASELSITTKESLQSDLDSLERMVVEYAVDYGNNHGSAELATIKKEIHEAVKEGDLTILMSKYEQDIRSPLRATIRGSLPRALLIQLQKTKVDGAVAISGIDKLLKSQQLVFGMVSISPSLIILYQLWNIIRRNLTGKPIQVNGKDVNLVCLKSLNNIEKYLNAYNEVSHERQTYIEGYLLIEIINLKRQSVEILPKNVQEMWKKDLNDVNDREWSVDGRLRVMSRIWSVYGHYFR